MADTNKTGLGVFKIGGAAAASQVDKVPGTNIPTGANQPQDAGKELGESDPKDPSPSEGERAWTSHPIANYSAGKFRFENGILRLSDSEEIAEFEKFLNDKNLPMSERHKIRELDVKGAEAISRKIRGEQGSSATKQSDSTIGERAVAPKTGSGDLASAKDGGAVQS